MNDHCINDEKKCRYLQQIPDLPVSDGYCLFHSTDAHHAADFEHYFKRYLSAVDDTTVKVHKLQNIVFKSLEDVIRFERLTFSRPLKFKKCTFPKRLELIDCTFANGVDFEDCDFQKGLKITGGSYGSFAILNGSMKGRVTINKIDELKNFFNLSGIDFINGLTLESIQMPLYFIMNHCTISMQSMRDISYFRKLSFMEAQIENVTAYAQVVMDQIAFARTSSFINMQFHTPASDFNTFENTLKFANISIPDENVRLSFKGTSDFKFTEVDTFISFLEMNGFLEFDYFDFTYLSAVSRETIFALEKEGKAQITNCTKYRHRTDTLDVLMDAGNHYLIEELTKTFTHYFNNANAYDIGVEIVSKSPKSIKLYYYTNEHITRDQFLERLGKSAQNMWNLMTQSASDSRELAKESDYETRVNLASFLLKLGARLKKQEIDSEALERIFWAVGGMDIDGVLKDTLEAAVKSDNGKLVFNFVQQNSIQLSHNTFIHQVETMDVEKLNAALEDKFAQMGTEIAALKDPILDAINQRSEEDKRMLLQLTKVLQSNLLDKKQIEEYHKKIDQAITKIDLEAVLAGERKILEAYLKDSKKNVGLKQKTKISIPIIPLFLKYEAEIDINIKSWIKEMIEDFRNGDIFIKE